jgi:molybdopterin converting factor small subunit
MNAGALRSCGFLTNVLEFACSMGNITLEVPRFFQSVTNDVQLVKVNGRTAGECLEDFVGQFPLARKLLFDKKGKLLGHIDLFVNGISTFPEELATPVKDGDKMTLLYLIDGG